MIKKILEFFKAKETPTQVSEVLTKTICPSKLKKGQIIINNKKEFLIKGISQITKTRFKALDFGPQITIHLVDLQYQYETSQKYSLRYKPTCCVKVA